MATKRIKFLHRRKILQQEIEIKLELLGLSKRFSAQLNLAAHNFPPDAKIYVEAKQLLERIRFDLGTVASPNVAASIDISQLKGERITFDVLVVDGSNARKLGSAETVRPLKTGEPSNNPKELLPIDAAQRLDGVLWRIDYSDNWEGASDAPILLFDKLATRESAASFVRNTWVRSLVFPSAMREILTKLLQVEEYSFDPAGTSWRDAWLRFASKAAGDEPPDVNDATTPASDIEDWIGRAVGKLATRAEFLNTLLKETN